MWVLRVGIVNFLGPRFLRANFFPLEGRGRRLYRRFRIILKKGTFLEVRRGLSPGRSSAEEVLVYFPLILHNKRPLVGIRHLCLETKKENKN